MQLHTHHTGASAAYIGSSRRVRCVETAPGAARASWRPRLTTHRASAHSNGRDSAQPGTVVNNIVSSSIVDRDGRSAASTSTEQPDLASVLSELKALRATVAEQAKELAMLKDEAAAHSHVEEHHKKYVFVSTWGWCGMLLNLACRNAHASIAQCMPEP